ncbi:hypothetical protein BDA99DRAFT_541563 [Phascolomyces articulosus]|uniref:Uncharacterized protein n=1 Tax=Phascolomyces articulosus TaxID=60185 RepID=A0AAD5JRU7_9FUNG|nr:hypothetical protein BDA99DRAFT_541563 [Phascolomyces articulosus]
MPSKLVRISDMKAVDGAQVNKEYCTLSYSWNQSGKVIKDKTSKKSKRIDEDKHKIILPEKSNIKRVQNFIQYMGIKDHVRYVKFEGIIQQLCQQFTIHYL